MARPPIAERLVALVLVVAAVCVLSTAAFVPTGTSGSGNAPNLGALAASRPPSAPVGLQARLAGTPVQYQGRVRAGALSLACVALVTAALRGLTRGRTAMCYQKRYGGGPVKKDPAAEFGPQYYGPPIHYGIQRKARLGMPRGGEQRVIPKLSGGSYDMRKNMMRSLTTELIRHGRIKTTYARAMALRSFVDRMIVLAKRGDDLARREASEWMFDENLVENLFKQAPERYEDRRKEFTQVTRTMNRKGDWAQMAYIELI